MCIAETAIIHDHVELGDNSSIGEYCIIGHPARGEASGKTLKIGAGANIRSHTIIYEGSEFGDQLSVGHSSILREGIKAGVNLQVGSMNDLEGMALIGDWVRFHSNVHVSRGTTIGDLVWIFPYVVTTNDPIPPSGLCEGVTLDAGSTVCTGSVVLPGTQVGVGAFIGAMTRAGGIIRAGALVIGNPAKMVGSVRRLKHVDSGKQHPWYTHHADAYPPKAQSRIAEILAEVETACDEIDSLSPG